MRGLGKSAGAGRPLVVLASVAMLVPLLAVANASAASGIAMTVRQISGTESDLAVTEAVLEVTLSAAGASPIYVAYETLAYSISHLCPAAWPSYCAEPGEDYLDSSGVLVFQPGVTRQTIRVRIVPDNSSEREFEYLTLSLTQVSAGPGEARIAGIRSGVYVRDDDPALSIDWYRSIIEGDEGTTNLTLSVWSSVIPTEPISVNFKTAVGAYYDPSLFATEGSDYVRASGVINFLPGERKKSIQIKIRGDRKAEGNGVSSVEIFRVLLSDVQNAQIWDEESLLFIEDDDAHSEGQASNADDLLNVPSTIGLSPNSSTGPVPGPHAVTATVRDRTGEPVAVSSVVFSVTGANRGSGQTKTGNSGTASFAYHGVAPGGDTISAFADINEDGVRQLNEPMTSAGRSWTIPGPKI